MTSPGKRAEPQQIPQQLPAELAEVAESWLALPEVVRAGILAMVRASR